MKKKYVIGILIILIIVMGVAVSLLLTGPHMDNADYIRTYESEQMLPPPRSVPVEIPPELPSADEKNSLDNTPENFNKGKIYYDYYCMFCHGNNLDGNGPVGESYVPKPAELKVDSIRNRTDGQLVRDMITGTGHYPVLERVIPDKYWWYLVLYVKNFRDTTDISDKKH
jgi:hypothetical protein